MNRLNRRDFLIRALQIAGVTAADLMLLESAEAFYNMTMLKKNIVMLKISTTTNKFVLTNALNARGWSGGAVQIHLTVDPGVYVWSDTIALPAMNLAGLPTGSTLTLINRGFILGMGGAGGGYGMPGGLNGQNGGPAMSAGCPVLIDNQSGYIGGGGGGGGGFGVNYICGGGGGAGGGGGGNAFHYPSSNTLSGGAGGLPGASGSNGSLITDGSYSVYAGGGGGRVFPGATTPGTPDNHTSFGFPGNGGSAGGSGSSRLYGTISGTTQGGSGGGAGVPGGNGIVNGGVTGAYTVGGGGGGGGWGAQGGVAVYQTSSGSNTTGGGGLGGPAVNSNGHPITWVGGIASSSRAYGPIT